MLVRKRGIGGCAVDAPANRCELVRPFHWGAPYPQPPGRPRVARAIGDSLGNGSRCSAWGAELAALRIAALDGSLSSARRGIPSRSHAAGSFLWSMAHAPAPRFLREARARSRSANQPSISLATQATVFSPSLTGLGKFWPSIHRPRVTRFEMTPSATRSANRRYRGAGARRRS